MYGKPAMICFKYQVYLCGSEAITYLNAILGVESHWSDNQLEENSSMVKLP